MSARLFRVAQPFVRRLTTAPQPAETQQPFSSEALLIFTKALKDSNEGVAQKVAEAVKNDVGWKYVIGGGATVLAACVGAIATSAMNMVSDSYSSSLPYSTKQKTSRRI